MSNQIANTLRIWQQHAERGESVELSADWLGNIADELDMLATASASAERTIERQQKEIDRLEAQLANREYRRAS